MERRSLNQVLEALTGHSQEPPEVANPGSLEPLRSRLTLLESKVTFNTNILTMLVNGQQQMNTIIESHGQLLTSQAAVNQFLISRISQLTEELVRNNGQNNEEVPPALNVQIPTFSMTNTVPQSMLRMSPRVHAPQSQVPASPISPSILTMPGNSVIPSTSSGIAIDNVINNVLGVKGGGVKKVQKAKRKGAKTPTKAKAAAAKAQLASKAIKENVEKVGKVKSSPKKIWLGNGWGYPCPICGVRVSSKFSQARHLRVVHKQDPSTTS